MKQAIPIFLKIYQVIFSPILHQHLLWPAGCRFTPTCSAYGAEAFRQYGLARGFVLLWRRFIRCRPGTLGGFDPVPPKPTKFISKISEVSS